MRHVPDDRLRRVLDEPFAVEDSYRDHLADCQRCRRRQDEMANDAAVASRVLARPVAVPDVDEAWCRNVATRRSPAAAAAVERTGRVRRGWLPALPRRPLGAAAAAVVLLAAGLSAGLLASSGHPTPPAPRSNGTAELQAIEDLAGDGGSGALGGFASASGTRRLPFGVLTWSSAGKAHRVPTVAAAEAATGLSLSVPQHLPPGVGSVTSVLVQPRVLATLRFDKGAGELAGRSLTISAGPAVLVEYGGGVNPLGLPSMALFTMARPSAANATTSAARLEAYVLSAPRVPIGFAQEVRLVRGTERFLPFAAPTGTHVRQVKVDGSPGILVTVPALGAAGVVWVDAHLVHLAAGLLGSKDMLGVASQIG